MKRILLAICLSVFCFGASATVEETAIRAIKSGESYWVKQPRIQLNNNELQGYDRTVLVGFYANESGFITSTKILESSGLDEIDKKVIMAVKMAKVKPYQINGVFYPISAKQHFTIMVSRDAEYQKLPVIPVIKLDLKGKDRQVVIYAEADDTGNVTRAEIKESSGLKVLDQYVLHEYLKQARFKPLSINGKSYPITKSTRFYFSEKDAIE
ncbi:TonB family protein [Acinetobacter rudis]|uniref:TonB family protein n=1 Tax=Acinetobacter rudis TaxID=632955 RepID=UPI0033419950